MSININFARVLFLELVLFFQSQTFLWGCEKARGFVLLFCGVVAAGRGGGWGWGNSLTPFASPLWPFGRRQIVWAVSPGDGGMWLPPGRGQERLPGSPGRLSPSGPLPFQEKAAESSPIGEPFISLFLQ